MLHARPMTRATFISRPNRFIAVVDINGVKTDVHVANSGRLRELLMPGRTVYLDEAAAGSRRTHYTLSLVQMPSALVSIDSRLASSLAAEAFNTGAFPRFSAFQNLRREVTYSDIRLDLMLSGGDTSCYIETKCSTRVRDGVAMFPDAPDCQRPAPSARSDSRAQGRL
ncbi:MAG: DNA/RNA nuclease SfsA [Dehalococcoidia bacterium]|nr:DNA/RNA nuclease SfsA [Dehalococcoidia bacterium]